MSETQQLLVRFRGICAHIDLPNGTRPKGLKRTVLLRHRNGTSGIERHIPYVEFYADDLESAPGLRVLQYSKPGSDGRFARVDLPEGSSVMTVIRIVDAEPGKVEAEPSYRRDVPHFSDILKDMDFKVEAAPTLRVPSANDVEIARASAVFDMPAGRLFGGEPEPMLTRFDPKIVTIEPRRFARWSDLYATVPAGKVAIELESRPKGEKKMIYFKDTLRMITIGNEPERLILGIIGAADSHAGHTHAHGNGNGARTQPTGHFILYYDLFETPPPLKPLPVPSQIEGSGCPNNNIP